MINYRIELKWGLLFVGMMLLWMLGERLVGLHDTLIAHHPTWTNLVAIPSILLYVLGLQDKRDNFYGGKMSWSQGFTSGLIITAVVAVLTPLSQWITSTIITPDFFSNAIAYGVKEGMTTQAEGKAFFNLQNYIIMGAIGAVVMGVMTSAIVALFVRQK